MQPNAPSALRAKKVLMLRMVKAVQKAVAVNAASAESAEVGAVGVVNAVTVAMPPQTVAMAITTAAALPLVALSLVLLLQVLPWRLQGITTCAKKATKPMANRMNSASAVHVTVMAVTVASAASAVSAPIVKATIRPQPKQILLKQLLIM